MSEPDEAMLWARERFAQTVQSAGLEGMADGCRRGSYDGDGDLRRLAEAHRAGQAAAQAKAEERVAGLVDAAKALLAWPLDGPEPTRLWDDLRNAVAALGDAP